MAVNNELSSLNLTGPAEANEKDDFYGNYTRVSAITFRRNEEDLAQD